MKQWQRGTQEAWKTFLFIFFFGQAEEAAAKAAAEAK